MLPLRRRRSRPPPRPRMRIEISIAAGSNQQCLRPPPVHITRNPRSAHVQKGSTCILCAQRIPRIVYTSSKQSKSANGLHPTLELNRQLSLPARNWRNYNNNIPILELSIQSIEVFNVSTVYYHFNTGL